MSEAERRRQAVPSNAWLGVAREGDKVCVILATKVKGNAGCYLRSAFL
jgi:hypothetical protein